MRSTKSHKALQTDWNQLGAESFAFEILDQLKTGDDRGGLDERSELAVLEQLWLEKLQPFGDRGYNEPQKSREEKLRRIAARRSGEDSGRP